MTPKAHVEGSHGCIGEAPPGGLPPRTTEYESEQEPALATGEDVGAAGTQPLVELRGAGPEGSEGPRKDLLEGPDEAAEAAGIELGQVCLLYTSDAADE